LPGFNEPIARGVAIGSLFCLAALGAISARTGGVGMLVPTLRVTFWGALAMAITAGVGLAFGATG